MTTSGSYDYNETRDQIISDALQLLNVLAAGETATANDITFCANALNKMIKAWMGQGIHLWTEEEGTIYLVAGQTQYSLPGANASDGSGTPVETTLSAAASLGASSISVTTATGMTIGDNIGIVINSTTTSMQWTTITNIVGTTISLNATLTAAASSGAFVATYTTAMPRVISIQSARVRDNGNFDRPVWIKARNDYMMIPQKMITGQINVVYYSPQMTTGILYVWPTTSSVSQRLKVTYLRTLQDFDTSSDTPDLPQEWLEPLTYNLAVRIAPAYGINLSSGGINGNPDILRQATQYLEDMKAWDAEQPGVQIVPNYRYNR